MGSTNTSPKSPLSYSKLTRAGFLNAIYSLITLTAVEYRILKNSTLISSLRCCMNSWTSDLISSPADPISTKLKCIMA